MFMVTYDCFVPRLDIGRIRTLYLQLVKYENRRSSGGVYYDSEFDNEAAWPSGKAGKKLNQCNQQRTSRHMRPL